MEQNDLIKKALLVELYRNAPEEVKQVLRKNEAIIKDKLEADKQLASLTGLKHLDKFYDNDGFTKWRVFEFPKLTDTEIANLQQIAASNKQNDIYRMVDNIHFWVKFWSILSIIGAVLTGILTAIL
ncbi:MAG: hypothetical protein II231_05080 [Rikenellaceae bacterium]|jgi:hypothetical protein|nr:hypothetical protein [Rikenellaceae bacterium]